MHFDFFSGKNPLLERADAKRKMIRMLRAVKNDPAKLLEIFGTAAFYGVPEGQLATAKGLLARASPRIQNDLSQYIVEAAESGIPEAQILLAYCYEQGLLFPKNQILAAHLRSMAAKN